MIAGEVTRKDFLKGALAALGLGALGGRRLFAVPEGWTPPSGVPDLVFGVISDTHIGKYPGSSVPCLKKVLGYFKKRGVQAVMHCGDISNWGEVWELQHISDAWNSVFQSGSAEPVKLFVTGNHDYYGGDMDKRVETGNANYYSALLYDNPETGNGGVVGWVSDFLEPGYSDVWHKTVKGNSGKLYHFFGFGGDESSATLTANGQAMAELVRQTRLSPEWDESVPFFTVTHIPPNSAVNAAVASALGLSSGELCYKGLGFYGHGHKNSSGWGAVIGWPTNACFPQIQCGLLGWKQSNGESAYPMFAKGFGSGLAEGYDNGEFGEATRHGFLVSVYSEAVVIHRLDFGHPIADAGDPGSVDFPSVGMDWVMSLGAISPDAHPFSMDSLKEAIGKPEFRPDATLTVSWEEDVVRLTIPKADGNSESRVYGYNVEVSGEKGALRKNVYAKGYAYGLGFEPDGGVTTLVLQKSELPSGNQLVFRVWPCSSLGTRGEPLALTSRAKISVEKTVSRVAQGERFVLTEGAGLSPDAKLDLECPPWARKICIENGEIVLYSKRYGLSVILK